MKDKQSNQDSWNASAYSQFLDLRTRPARDLLSVIPSSFLPNTAYDLGCGPGNSTILLKQRWSDAQVIGIDSSQDMLKTAQASYPGLEFSKMNIDNFAPSAKTDLIFANASLQWLDNHALLIPKLIQSLNSGGVLAIQMPNNFHAPSHQVTLQILQDNVSWKPLLNNLRYGVLTEPFYQISRYYDLLNKVGLSGVQVWETEYYQEMNNHQAVFNWVKGTGLRPILSAMDAENQSLFAQAYVKAIKATYPVQANGKILLPFRRLFMVASSSAKP